MTERNEIDAFLSNTYEGSSRLATVAPFEVTRATEYRSEAECQEGWSSQSKWRPNLLALSKWRCGLRACLARVQLQESRAASLIFKAQ